MQWEFVVAVTLAIPIILLPAILIWYLNVGGLYVALKERRLMKAIARKALNALAVIVPVGIYVLAVWVFFGNFGWQVALALSLVFPVVLLVPFLVWAVVVSGLLHVVRDAARRRAMAPRRRVLRTAEAPVLSKSR